MAGKGGERVRVHLYKPAATGSAAAPRMPFYEFRVVGADGTQLGSTTRTLGNGLQFGEAIDYVVGKIAEREAAATKKP